MGISEHVRRLFSPPTTYVRRYRCEECGATVDRTAESCPDCDGDVGEVVGAVQCSYWGQYY